MLGVFALDLALSSPRSLFLSVWVVCRDCGHSRSYFLVDLGGSSVSFSPVASEKIIRLRMDETNTSTKDIKRPWIGPLVV